MNKNISKRLLPLYIAAFFQGFVVWYATEKVFMKTIGYDNASIGTVTAGISVIILLFEAPSGILADRWSRKGVLAVASIFLMFASLIGGLSNSIWVYFAGICCWAIFFALYSGTYDSIVYDVLLEEEGKSSNFEKFFGRVRITDSVALVMGSLMNFVIVDIFGLRATYFVTIPMSFLSLLALYKFREPNLHRQSARTHWLHHSAQTLRAVMNGPTLFWIATTSVFLALGQRIVFEFSQLWYIALVVPLAAFGPFSALLHTTIGLGGFVASRLSSKKRTTVSFTILLLSTFGFLMQSLPIVVMAVFVSCTLFMGLIIIMLHKLHDNLKSNLRAGAASTVSSIGQIVFIPISVLFGLVAQRMSVFQAGWFVIVSAALALVGHLFMTKNKKSVKLAR